ncbi:MAG: tRNA preQ1(34) S-adenosylmethionine ribosyltransferase-isomerase QueA [Gammaproteobacteria bacterium]|nr:tRNA preQ1(34) S-adenosylmethionine ribosyltransferase-isomerase QueA [Gammaproteobacteria bacterium]
MRRSDFRYALPKRLIAQAPLAERAASRLLVLDDRGATHRQFTDLVDLLRPGDLLVLNDTRVVKARLFGTKDTGGKAEILVERMESDCEALCQVRVSKPLKPGRTVSVGGAAVLVVARCGAFYRLRFPGDLGDFLEAHGDVPLPPYVERPAGPEDAARYQTVYADRPGAVAAPTAGLHFDDALLQAIGERGVRIVRVTLHVGAGTFQPVRTEDVSRHRMHEERFDVPVETACALNARRGRVVAVGTTVVRTLESALDADGRVRSGPGTTALFIVPGYRFRAVDALVTNFHLPESTLIMLVAAFAGYDRVMDAYREAVAREYRFFSYGDAMFCERDGEASP